MSDQLKWIYPPPYSPCPNFRHFLINDHLWAMNSIDKELDLIDLLHTGIVHWSGYGTFIYLNGILTIPTTIHAHNQPLIINISPNRLEQFIIDGILMYDRRQKL